MFTESAIGHRPTGPQATGPQRREISADGGNLFLVILLRRKNSPAPMALGCSVVRLLEQRSGYFLGEIGDQIDNSLGADLSIPTAI